MNKLIETNIRYLCEICSRPIFIIQNEKHCLYCRGFNDGQKSVEKELEKAGEAFINK